MQDDKPDTKPTHTPGPWRTGRKVHRTIYCEEAGSEGRLIGVMDRREDATLVAAAPEMLEACSLALAALLVGSASVNRESAILALRVAIAKAEGREP
ncbi:MAG: hypothetical protein JXA90_03185 [Planctomycetes bacterium]|nr:hypothetical protein [Planctomycetota bacterium]